MSIVRPFYSRVWALRRVCRIVEEFVKGDGSIRLMFEDGLLQEVLLPEEQ